MRCGTLRTKRFPPSKTRSRASVATRARAVGAGEQLNRAVLASLSTEIAILDRDGVISRVNEAWRERARQSGVPEWRDAFIGENYLDECRRAEEDGCTEANDVRRGLEA